jgi:hypothetical protein
MASQVICLVPYPSFQVNGRRHSASTIWTSKPAKAKPVDLPVSFLPKTSSKRSAIIPSLSRKSVRVSNPAKSPGERISRIGLEITNFLSFWFRRGYLCSRQFLCCREYHAYLASSSLYLINSVKFSMTPSARSRNSGSLFESMPFTRFRNLEKTCFNFPRTRPWTNTGAS